ncbi:MAG: epoxyqueuosine reductase QueH [Bacteroidaceae bacterium]|nr:epoxyqueuosine reductase QueH [Bacteroidaceae bacterium]
MSKRNFQKELEHLIEGMGDRVPSLLLHSCCAPCSSYTLEYLSRHFNVTVLYFNPNIMRMQEYGLRLSEQERFINEFNEKCDAAPVGEEREGHNPVCLIAGRYEPKDFVDAVKGYEKGPEGGERCRLCYRLRLEETARIAKEKGFDYFCTTLSISPLKRADWINEIGESLSETYGVKWLVSDFKKREGYKRSIELSAEYGLYRQNFCGCEYSRREAVEN